MLVSFKLQGSLRDLLPTAQHGQTTISLTEDTTLGQALAELGVQRAVLAIRHGSEKLDGDSVLRAGDRISLYAASAGG
jgi:sulfur carrier protein ThiS